MIFKYFFFFSFSYTTFSYRALMSVAVSYKRLVRSSKKTEQEKNESEKISDRPFGGCCVYARNYVSVEMMTSIKFTTIENSRLLFWHVVRTMWVALFVLCSLPLLATRYHWSSKCFKDFSYIESPWERTYCGIEKILGKAKSHCHISMSVSRAAVVVVRMRTREKIVVLESQSSWHFFASSLSLSLAFMCAIYLQICEYAYEESSKESWYIEGKESFVLI